MALAISGVALNLHDEIFKPAVSFFSPVTASVFDVGEIRPPEAPAPTALPFPQVLRARLGTP